MLHQRRTIYLLGLFSAFLVALVNLWSLWDSHSNSVAFQRNIWVTGSQDVNMLEARNKMVPDLQRHYLKKGMTHTQVLSLLGPPSNREPDSLIYMMGFAHSWSDDQDYLQVDFDKSGRLASAMVRAG